MKSPDSMKVRSFLNKIRGVPIELDLMPYHEVLLRVNEQDLSRASDETLRRMSS